MPCDGINAIAPCFMSEKVAKYGIEFTSAGYSSKNLSFQSMSSLRYLNHAPVFVFINLLFFLSTLVAVAPQMMPVPSSVEFLFLFFFCSKIFCIPLQNVALKQNW